MEAKTLASEGILLVKSAAIHYFAPLMHHPCLPWNMAGRLAFSEEGNESQVRNLSLYCEGQTDRSMWQDDVAEQLLWPF